MKSRLSKHPISPTRWWDLSEHPGGEVSNAERDRRQGAAIFAATRAVRTYLPLLPDLGIAQAQRPPLRAVRAPRSSFSRLATIDRPRRSADRDFCRPVV